MKKLIFIALSIFLLLGFSGVLNADDVAPIAKGRSEIVPFVPNATTNFGNVILDENDLDSDGLPNDYELANGLKPDDASDAFLDADGDGLLNIEEFDLGTDPQDADTDSDGFTDFEENFAGTDPLDDQDFPITPPVIPTIVFLDIQASSSTIVVNSIVGSAPFPLTVTAIFSDSTQKDVTADIKTIYQTSDPTIATVSATGEVVGVDAGTVVIAVTNSGVSAQATFTVDRFVPQIVGQTNIGAVDAIAINQPYVFLGQTSGLSVYDVSIPQSPLLVINDQNVGGAINDMQIVGSRLYVAVSGVGLKIFDVSVLPAGPVEIGNVALPGIVSLDLDGSQLVASLGAEIVLIDITDPAMPVTTHTVTATSNKVAVDAIRNVVYSITDNILEVYFADPSGQLILQSSLVLGAFIRDLDINEAVVYLAMPNPLALQVVDTSNLLDPLLLGTLPDNFNSFAVRYFGDQIFLADNLFVNLVPIINVNDPANPILAGNPQSNDSADGIAIDVSGNLVAVATNEGFQLVRWLQDELGVPPQITQFAATPTTLVGGAPFTVQASAIDDVAISFFELLIDGQVVQQITGSSATFQTFSPLSVGGESLLVQVRALDIGGGSALSEAQTVNLLADTQPPVVAFTNLIEGQVVDPGEPLTVVADVVDNIGLSRVDFLVDDVLVSSKTLPPFDFTFTPPLSVAEAVVNIKVMAFDQALPLNLMTQAEVNVVVPALKDLMVAPATSVLLGAGKILNLEVTGILQTEDKVDLTSALMGSTYQSSDESIATVSTQGVVTAVNSGQVTITVSNGSLQVQAQLTVFADPDPSDLVAPETQIVGLTSTQEQLTFQIPFSVVSGSNDLATTRLFFRRSDTGVFALYRPEGNPQGFFFKSPINFDASFTGGDGTYEFYTSALDINGNEEEPPDTFVSTIVDSGQPVITFTADTLIDENDFNFDFKKIKIDGATVTINGEHTFSRVEVVNGGVINHSPTTATEIKRLFIRTPLLVVDATSAIDVTGRGFLGANQEGNPGNFGLTLGNVPVSIPNSAGSFGGFGEVSFGDDRVPLYGDYRNPIEPGTGGSSSSGFLCGNGGGVIRLDVGVFSLQGAVRSNADNNIVFGGSGGSILLNVDTLTGRGTIESLGGGFSSNSVKAGGGRIAIYYNDLSGFDLDNIGAFGGAGIPTSSSFSEAGAGTVFLKSAYQQFGEIIINNTVSEGFTFKGTTLGRFVGVGTSESLVYDPTTDTTILTDSTADFPLAGTVKGALGLVGLDLNPNVDQDQFFLIVDNTSTTITVLGDLTQVANVGDPYSGVNVLDKLSVINNTNLVMEDQILQASLIELKNAGALSHLATTATEVHRLHVKAGTIDIDATSAIDVSNLGFLGANQPGNASEFGLTLGNVPVSISDLTLSAFPNVAGSFGGLGGRSFQAGGENGDRVSGYGDYRNPVEPGTGGSSSNVASNGGGVIRLDADVLSLQGIVRSSGGVANGSSGSGGSILLNVKNINGSGTIEANGDFRPGFGLGSRGGGGRIAIYYEDISGFDLANIQAFGGEDDSNPNPILSGGAGTIFLKSPSQPIGELIIDNNGTQTSTLKATTLGRFVGVGTSENLVYDAVTDTTVLTDTSADFPLPGAVEGALGLVGLDLNPNVEQDQAFPIIDNTNTTITVQGDLTQVANVGDPYSGVNVLDKLLVTDDTDLGVEDQILQTTVLELENGSVLSHIPTTATEIHRLHVKAGVVNIDATSAIDVTGRGFLGSNQPGNPGLFGLTLGNVPVLNSGTGGSHGGLGGVIGSGERVPGYGDYRRPVEPGTGGSTTGTGGNGGGVIRLEADVLFLAGAIRSNGNTVAPEVGEFFFTSSGSGGSILLNVKTLIGNGTIEAKQEDFSSAIGGRGGGGRIALYYENISIFDLTNINAFGGKDDLGPVTILSAGAGTIFLKSPNQQHGELIIDNNGTDTTTFTTVLRSVGTGTSRALVYDALADTTDLTDNSAEFDQPNSATGALGLVGLQLNPQLNQDQTFSILNNNGGTITVMGDMTQVANPGDAYIGTYFLDGLTLKGKARLKTDDRVVITGSPGFFFDGNDADFMFGDFQIAGDGVDLSLTSTTLTLPNDDGTTYGTIDLNDSTLILEGQGTLMVDDFNLINNSTLTIADPTSTSVSAIKLDVTNALSVDPTSSITVTDKGFLGGLRGDNVSSDAITLGFSSLGSQLSDGGSYGGLGGINSSGGDPNRDFVNPIYGSVIAPVDPGSGGGGTINGQGAGGNGGSVVSIDAANLILGGTIESRGGDGQGNEGAPGSGGSIFLSVSNTISGTGSINADGGNRSGVGAGGGGGGRVALYFNDMTGFTGSLSATGGTGSPPGMDGTVFSQMGALLGGEDDSPRRTLIYDRKDRPEPRWVTVPVIDGLNHLKALGGSKVQWEDTLNFTGQESSIFVSEKSQLKGQALSFADEAAFKIKGLGKFSLESLHLLDHRDSHLTLERSTLTFVDDLLSVRVPVLNLIEGATLTTRRQADGRPIRLHLQVRELAVDSRSSIDVSGLGYLGAAQGVNRSLTGRTYSRENPAGTIYGGSSFSSGGSHRTLGTGQVPGSTYGNAKFPTTFGSGGGSLDFEKPGGSGGGAIHIEARSIELEGSIAANGEDSTAGAGAGGSVLIQADDLVGAGSIQAHGGSALETRAHPGGKGYIFLEVLKRLKKETSVGFFKGEE